MAEYQTLITCTTDTTSLLIEGFNRDQKQKLRQQQLKIASKCTFIIQDQQSSKITSEETEPSSSSRILFKMTEIVNEEENYCLIEPAGFNIYEVYRKLKKGDVYKLGEKTLKVLNVGQFDKMNSRVKKANSQIHFLNPENEEQQLKENTKECMKCKRSQETKQNRISTYCKCSSGSSQIHQNCLSDLLVSRSYSSMKKLDGNFILPIKSLHCVKCNSYYHLPLITKTLFQKQLSELIILSDRDTLYAIPCINQEIISLGRVAKQNSYIVIEHNSVSRSHSEIFYNNHKKCFYIKDSNSRYGTLRQVNRCIVKDKAEIQVGNNIFKMRRRQKEGLFESIKRFCRFGREQ